MKHWKAVGLWLLALLGVWYALPSLFGQVPALEVAVKVATDPLDACFKQAHAKRILQQDARHWLLRFDSVEQQLLAREQLKTCLPEDASVALNLVSRAPKIFENTGASPIKLGLDLRGGVHFLLALDMSSVLTREIKMDIRAGLKALRMSHIRYTSFKSLSENQFEITLVDPEKNHAALEVITGHLPHWNGVIAQRDPKHLIWTFNQAAKKTFSQHILEQTMAILRNRVNELGIAEAIVQQQGANRIAVDLPGIQDPLRARKILGGTSTLEFRMVKESGQGQSYAMRSGGSITLSEQVVLNGSAITSASSGVGEDARPQVELSIAGSQVGEFSRTTLENVGHRMGIVFIHNKQRVDENGQWHHERQAEVISAPVIQSGLGRRFVINGIESPEEAQNLALLLRSGALLAPIAIVEEQTIGPSLGRDNIARGLWSLVVGLGLVMLFMALYYQVFGLIANVALLLNLVLLIALLSVMGATLTLPGMAGIVLTLGMSVDANVLIYERIREEMRSGQAAWSSIQAGYEKAFATIIDSNLTTLIAAIALFSIGSGAIKGFAITLCFGLLTSMLTGVVYTRAIVSACFAHRQDARLPIGV